jgi:homoserine O-acetyltransferase/O-succinyltransferase
MTVTIETTLRRQTIGRFTFDSGITLDDVVVTFDVDPAALPATGTAMVCPSLTGTPAIMRAWWHDVTTPAHRATLATLYPHAFAADTLGALPPDHVITIRDMARAAVSLATALALPPLVVVAGGSLGGMIALEVGVVSASAPQVLCIAAPAVQSAWGAGWNHIQLAAIALGGADAGVRLARAVGMMTYRTEQEFEARFGVDAAPPPDRTMISYLVHHGEALLRRFDPAEYARRVRAMDTHDVGRGRGGWRPVLAACADRLTAIGITGDALYSDALVADWIAAVGGTYRRVTSVHGHDAFLLELDQMRTLVAAALTRVAVPAAATA